MSHSRVLFGDQERCSNRRRSRKSSRRCSPCTAQHLRNQRLQFCRNQRQLLKLARRYGLFPLLGHPALHAVHASTRCKLGHRSLGRLYLLQHRRHQGIPSQYLHRRRTSTFSGIS